MGTRLTSPSYICWRLHIPFLVGWCEKMDIYQALFKDDGKTVFLRIHCLLASLSWRIYAPYVNRRHAKPEVSFQSHSRGNEQNMCIMKTWDIVWFPICLWVKRTLQWTVVHGPRQKSVQKNVELELCASASSRTLNPWQKFKFSLYSLDYR